MKTLSVVESVKVFESSAMRSKSLVVETPHPEAKMRGRNGRIGMELLSIISQPRTGMNTATSPCGKV